MDLKTIARAALGRNYVGVARTYRALQRKGGDGIMSLLPAESRVAGVVEYFVRPQLRQGYGGPFNGQVKRQEMFCELVGAFDFAALVETGTYRGTTTAYLNRVSGKPVFTVEIHPTYYGFALARFFTTRSVKPSLGDTRSVLATLLSDPLLRTSRMFFYLDAHTKVAEHGLPLNDELETIFDLCEKAVVMIDDFAVPDDHGYMYTDYGKDRAFNLDLIAPVQQRVGFVPFFPSAPSERETGRRRGCVILARDPNVVRVLRGLSSLRELPETF